MLNITAPRRIWLCTQPTDMRRSFNGLSALVKNHLGEDPTSGHWFAFINRRRTQIKRLALDAGGYCLWSKRLEQGQFATLGHPHEYTYGASNLLSTLPHRRVKRFVARAATGITGMKGRPLERIDRVADQVGQMTRRPPFILITAVAEVQSGAKSGRFRVYVDTRESPDG